MFPETLKQCIIKFNFFFYFSVFIISVRTHLRGFPLL